MRFKKSDVAECAYKYKVNNDTEALWNIIKTYMYIIKLVVKEFASKCEIEHDELLSIAIMGAINRINKMSIKNITTERVYSCVYYGSYYGIKIEIAKRNKIKEISLDEYNSKHNNGEDKYYISDDILLKNLQTDKIFDVLHTLTDRERKVIELYFYEELTLKEIGEIFDVTLETIRQNKEKAIRKLRHPYRSRQIKDFIEK